MTGIEESRRSLGARLRELRKDAHMDGRQLSAVAGWHWSKTSRIEHGKQTPSEDDIHLWCQVCAAEYAIPDLIATLRNLNAAYFEWKRLNAGGIRRRQGQTAQLEARTKLVRGYDPDIIPGLLQTRDYSAGILATCIDFLQVSEDLDAAVDMRMRRQAVLEQGVHRFSFIVAERALYATVRDDVVMTEQLAHLLEVMASTRVHLGVIPHAAAFSCPATGFLMYDRKLVQVETLTAELTIRQPSELVLYDRAFGLLAKQAAIGDSARALITKAWRSTRANS